MQKLLMRNRCLLRPTKSLAPLQLRRFSARNDLEKTINNQIDKDKEFFFPESTLKENTSESRVQPAEESSKIVHKVQLNEGVLNNPEPQKTELQLQEEEEKLPLSVREKLQTVKVYQTFKTKAQWGEFYRVYGMCLLALGGYFLSVPFYNVVCSTFGFKMSTHYKNYHFDDEKVNVFRKYRVIFQGQTQDNIPWDF